MTLNSKNETAFKSLRRQAEQVIVQRRGQATDLFELEWRRVLTELEVYQVELELQNQELDKATKELESARNDYFEFYDSAPVAFVSLSRKGTIERANRAAARLLAKPLNLLENTSFARFVHPADQAPFFSYLNQIAAGKKHSSREMRLREKKSQPVWVHFVAKPIFDKQKKSTGWRLSVVDVTERKQQEQALQKARDELERRTGQLARLSLELTMAEQRERSRLAEMMHDHLQQLLAGARHNLDIAAAESPEEPPTAFKNAYDLILKSLKAARTLSAELSPPGLIRQGLPEAFRWLAQWMKKTHAMDVEIHVNTEDYPVEEAIKILLFQSVRELLFNVTKHADKACAQVALTSRDARLEIAVSDSGAGFDPQNLWQSDAETDRGFGLFSIRERLALINGTFAIESAPDRGTTVTLTAPMRTDADLDQFSIKNPEPYKAEDALNESTRSSDQ